jgi:hypothetical protein
MDAGITETKWLMGWCSYGVGLLGALAYIRMLGNSVDGLASNSSGGAVR